MQPSSRCKRELLPKRTREPMRRDESAPKRDELKPKPVSLTEADARTAAEARADLAGALLEAHTRTAFEAQARADAETRAAC
jgi:hypothetical protein